MINRWTRVAALAVTLAGTSALTTHAQTGTIEKVEVQGLVRMTNEAFTHAFDIRAGDTYDPAKIRQRFRALWDLRLFEDIRVDAVDGAAGGKILIVVVKERRMLSSVSYDENKVLTRTAIEDRLKEKKVALSTGKPLDMKAVFDAEATIRDLLGEKGYLDPVVRHRVDEPTETSAAVTFTIKPGAKTKIRDIEFVGNNVYSDRRLLKQLKLTRSWRWYWPLSGKSLYHPAKWDQDAGGIRDLYLNTGYLDVVIRPPAVEVREKVEERKPAPAPEPGPAEAQAAPAPAPDDTAPAETAKERLKRAEKERKAAEKERRRAEKAASQAEPKVKRWAYLTVRVDEGAQYRLGKASVTGATVFSEAQTLGRLSFLREGALVDASLLDTAVKSIQRAYQDRGYAYATARREIARREGDEKIADVKFIISEDKQYTVGRIEFSGNTQTQDRVLRREFRLAEGEIFSRSLLDLSVGKVNQLGYFEVRPDDVVVVPVEGTSEVAISVPGEEKGRNEIQIGGGYSGLDGAFFTGLYSTRNLLGRGQVVSLQGQIGGRATRYQLAFSEPWFLGRPYTLGFTLFRSEVDYGATQSSTGSGFGVLVGRQIGPFSSIQARYDAQRVESRGFSFNTTIATNKISSITPSYFYNRVDNPYRPSRGWSFAADVQIAGGPLGGDTDVIRPKLEYSGYYPFRKRTFIALHAEVGGIRTWSDGGVTNSATVNGVPRYSRFWLGGDTLGPRVFETRAISPLRFVRLDPTRTVIVETTKDPRNRAAADFDLTGDGIVDERDLVDLGGDRYILTQAEFVVPFQTPMELAFFVDAASTLFEDTSWGFDEARVAVGVELRFYLPVFPVPLRLIYGAPIRKYPQDRTNAFMFSIGRSF